MCSAGLCCPPNSCPPGLQALGVIASGLAAVTVFGVAVHKGWVMLLLRLFFSCLGRGCAACLCNSSGSAAATGNGGTSASGGGKEAALGSSSSSGGGKASKRAAVANGATDAVVTVQRGSGQGQEDSSRRGSSFLQQALELLHHLGIHQAAPLSAAGSAPTQAMGAMGGGAWPLTQPPLPGPQPVWYGAVPGPAAAAPQFLVQQAYQGFPVAQAVLPYATGAGTAAQYGAPPPPHFMPQQQPYQPQLYQQQQPLQPGPYPAQQVPPVPAPQPSWQSAPQLPSPAAVPVVFGAPALPGPTQWPVPPQPQQQPAWAAATPTADSLDRYVRSMAPITQPFPGGQQPFPGGQL